MRQIQLRCLDRNVSALGFGCASLGSRISPTAGQRAAFRALDLGVTWFDVAPSYGDGQAEELLGKWLSGERRKIVICTKVGIEPPQIARVQRLVRPFIRPLVKLIPQIRQRVSRLRPTGRHIPIEPEEIEGLVARSLRRLRTDYIDVLALHEPNLSVDASDRVFKAIAQVVKKGMVRSVSLAGVPESIWAAVAAGHSVDFFQFRDTPFEGAAPLVRKTICKEGAVFVTHGVYGSGTLERLHGLRQASIDLFGELARRLNIPERRLEVEILGRFAFANNPEGVVVFSMFQEGHLKFNAKVASMVPDPQLADEVRRIVNCSGNSHA
jgi:aryl-alcohol dehydrogenase-like predicted oxidoreductase